MDEYNLFLLLVIPFLFIMGLRIKAFTIGGAIVASIVGAMVIIGGGWLYFAILFFFLGLSYISTLAGFERKERIKAQEGKMGERSAVNVLAAGILPAAISFLSFSNIHPDLIFILFVVSLGTILADTAASEIGTLDDNTYFILTLKPAETGTNGGISILGTSVSLVVPLLFSLIGFMIYGTTISLPFQEIMKLTFASGFIAFGGCLLDSVLGETLENRGYLDKYSVNFLASLFSVFIAAILFFPIN